jgi:hypothetical protein
MNEFGVVVQSGHAGGLGVVVVTVGVTIATPFDAIETGWSCFVAFYMTLSSGA